MEALCRDPSELINELCRLQVDASELRSLGEGLYSFCVPARAVERVRGIGVRTGAEIRVVRRRGFLHFLRRFHRRLYLLLIPLPFLLGFLWLSTCLWEFEVQGNEMVTRAEILDALEAAGVYPGVSGLRLDNAQIRSRMLAALGRLSWCTVQVRGSRALVEVRERRLPPTVVDEHLEREVAAARAGTVETIRVLEGKPLVRRGDTVLGGQTLITGVLPDRQGQVRRVHAMGKVFARTWYEKSMVLPNKTLEKHYTGVEKTLFSLKICDLRLNFYNDSSFSGEGYDKISSEHRLSIFGLSLPLSIQRSHCRAYELRPCELSEDAAVAVLEQRLLDWLSRTVPDAEILETGFQRESSGGLVRVTMLAQCREEIGTEREICP